MYPWILSPIFATQAEARNRKMKKASDRKSGNKFHKTTMQRDKKGNEMNKTMERYEKN